MKETEKSLIPYYRKIIIAGWEKWREYRFPDGEVVRIDSPEFLIVSDNGHRVGAGQMSYYIPYGWIELKWMNREDRVEHFFCETKKEEQDNRVSDDK